MNLSEERDPKINYFFLHFKYGNRVMPVWKFSAQSLDVAYHPDMQAQKVVGHILLSRGRGLVEFECRLPASQVPSEASTDKFDIVNLMVVPGSEKIINRREFIRHVFSAPVSIRLYPAQNKGLVTDAKLVDVSAGGIGLAIQMGGVESGSIYYVAIPKGVVSDKEELWPILVVRDFKPKSDNLKNLHGYGAYFVTNQNLVNGPYMTDRMQAGLVKFINRAAILSRQLELNPNESVSKSTKLS